MKQTYTLNHRGVIALIPLLLIGAGGVGATYIYQDHQAIKQLSNNQRSMGRDIDTIGNAVYVPNDAPKSADWHSYAYPHDSIP